MYLFENNIISVELAKVLLLRYMKTATAIYIRSGYHILENRGSYNKTGYLILRTTAVHHRCEPNNPWFSSPPLHMITGSQHGRKHTTHTNTKNLPQIFIVLYLEMITLCKVYNNGLPGFTKSRGGAGLPFWSNPLLLASLFSCDTRRV